MLLVIERIKKISKNIKRLTTSHLPLYTDDETKAKDSLEGTKERKLKKEHFKESCKPSEQSLIT